MAGGVLVAGLLMSACGGTGEAGKSADQILADAAAALRSAKSFHLDVSQSGTSSSSNGGLGNVTVAVDVVAGQGASAAIKAGSIAAKLVISGGKVYLQGKDFWSKFAGVQAANLIGDRWVILPSGSTGLSDLLMFSDTAKLATCLQLDHGTLSKGGTTTVAGQDAVILVDKGDKPGTSPGKLYVATANPNYPLKSENSGATKPGTPPGGTQCTGSSQSSDGSGGSSTISISEFNQTFTVKAPSGALDLQSLLNGGGA